MSGLSNCPHCHHPVTPTDDICENCGAVLSTLVIAPVHSEGSASDAPHTLPPFSPVALPSTPANGLTECPHCKHLLPLGADICEQCGLVLNGTTTPPVASTPLPQPASTIPTPIQAQCPRCQAPRAPGVKFCGRCGYNYLAASPTRPDLAQEDTSGSPWLLRPGSVLNNKYRIVKEIGSGGMGMVYLADDMVLKHQVVLKALLRDVDPGQVAVSVKEWEFLENIHHPNIVSIYDIIARGSQCYIVMEYVRGKTLEQLLEERGGPFDVTEAIRYILGILPAFSQLAQLNLVYCDFKPQNVMVDVRKDGTVVVKLIDLGTVTRHLTTRASDVYGTHGFYAPEAVKSPSPATDLYSICRTLAYMVSQMDLANPIFGMPPATDYKVFRDHPALYRLLVKGTNSKPQRRFQSAEELSEQLSGVLRQIVGGKPGIPVGSRLFVPVILAAPGASGMRYEPTLDENDAALDLLRYGDQARRNSNYPRALTFYRQALAAHPQCLDAHLRLADMHIERVDLQQAQSALSAARQITEDHWKIAWYTARLHEASDKIAAAADQYRELLTELPGELPPQHVLARVYARMNKDKAAIDLYRNVLKADPGNAEVALDAAQSLLNLEGWVEAIKLLTGINETSPRYIDAQLLLIELYLYRMQPLMSQNVLKAANLAHDFAARTEDSVRYLAHGDVYRAAWRLVRARELPPDVAIPGAPQSDARTLRKLAHENYQRYLQLEPHPTNREEIARRKHEVSFWRFF